MPATSKAQQRLMGMAYACKIGKANYCPPRIKKIASSMSKQDLKDFAETKHSDLPEKVRESIIYKVSGANNTLFSMFKDWLTKKNIQFIENQSSGEFEILNNYDLEKNDQYQLLTYVNKIGLKKIWENFGTPADGQGSSFATLGNTIGAKFVDPPGPGKVGSGDRFDNNSASNNPGWLKKKKPKKNNTEDKYVKSFSDFLKDKKKRNK